MKEGKEIKFLLTKSREMFMKYGVKNMSMDEIAKELGMSKKTIYQFVENKAELVKLTLDDYLNEERRLLENILANSKNSIDQMIQMIDYFLQAMSDFNPSALHDLQKYYPESWLLYNNYRYQVMLGCINDNLKTGVKEGYYRKDLNADMISKIYVFGTETLFNQDVFPSKKYMFLDIYREYLNYHLRGIVSHKGLKYLDEHNLFKS